MAHDVFISHSAKNKTTADAVCATLESAGIRCWIAPRDVLPGMEWGECIIDAIEQTRIMLLIFTADANASPQIRREVERAVNHGVTILPLRIEDVLPAKALEYFIGSVHWLDAITPPLEAHLKQIAETIQLLLSRMPPRAIEPAPPPAQFPAPSNTASENGDGWVEAILDSYGAEPQARQSSPLRAAAQPASAAGLAAAIAPHLSHTGSETMTALAEPPAEPTDLSANASATRLAAANAQPSDADAVAQKGLRWRRRKRLQRYPHAG